MIQYEERNYHYRTPDKKFERFGSIKWDIRYTAKAIIVFDRYLPIVDDMEFAYKLRKNYIASCYSPKEFVRHFFTGSVTDVWASKICHWVYEHGKKIYDNTLAYIDMQIRKLTVTLPDGSKYVNYFDDDVQLSHMRDFYSFEFTLCGYRIVNGKCYGGLNYTEVYSNGTDTKKIICKQLASRKREIKLSA